MMAKMMCGNLINSLNSLLVLQNYVENQENQENWCLCECDTFLPEAANDLFVLQRKKLTHSHTHRRRCFRLNEENAPYKTKHLDGTTLWYNLNKPTTIIIIYGMLWRRYRQCFWFLVLNFDSIQYQDTDKLHLVLTWKFFPLLLLLLSNDLL